MTGTINRLFVVAALAAVLLGSHAEAAATKIGSDHGVQLMHQMHTLMHHGLMMALQGSNMLMLSEMGSSPELNRASRTHALKMIAEGKRTVKEALSGSVMQKVHEEGRWNDPLMGYTHQLGAEILAVLDDLDKMEFSDPHSSLAMRLHQVHMALNHALEMAAEGSNLIMLGRMKMTGALDQQTVNLGQRMMADARSYWEEVAGGETLKGVRKEAAASPDSARLAAHTENLVKHGEKVLALLDKMNKHKH